MKYDNTAEQKKSIVKNNSLFTTLGLPNRRGHIYNVVIKKWTKRLWKRNGTAEYLKIYQIYMEVLESKNYEYYKGFCSKKFGPI